MRDRITELRRVPAGELRAHPHNWRLHPAGQRSALSEMLREVGIVDAVIARESGDGLELVDGHLRAEVLDGETVPVLVVDLDAAEAESVLASLDPIAAMARTDSEALGRLLERMGDEPPPVWGETAAAVLSPASVVPPPIEPDLASAAAAGAVAGDVVKRHQKYSWPPAYLMVDGHKTVLPDHLAAWLKADPLDKLEAAYALAGG